MEANRQRNALINFVLMLLAAAMTFVAARYGHVLAGQITAFFMAIGVVVCAVSWFQMRLEEQERLEKLEQDELARAAARTTLFEGDGEEIFQARRVRQQFEKFFVPAVAILLCLVQFGGAFWLWRTIGKAPPVEPRQPMVAVAIFGIIALVLFLLGKYSAGIARLEQHRLLSPQAGYVLLGAYLLGLVITGLVFVQAGVPAADRYLARGLCVLLGLLGVETFIRLLLEIYRPRIKGRIGPPLYESRTVGLLSRPEGLLTTAAHALDYQFGFKVSETWFYRFLEKAFAWLLLAQLGILLLSTCFVFVNTGEQALLERGGTFRRLLDAGPHLKMPWPFERVYRYPTDQVQHFTVGYAHEEEGEADHRESKAVLWTVSHNKQELHLLVASREQETATNAAGTRRSPPVSLLSVSIPVQYQVTNLKSWAYNYREPAKLLEKIGTREVVRYLVNADVHEVMSSGKFAAADELRSRIQKSADALGLGATILFVGLQDVHPPVNVARAYEAVVGAEHKRKAAVLSAEAYRVQTNALAAADAFDRINDAQAQSANVKAGARARAALFTNQVHAFRAAPTVYALRTYLKALEATAASARKYVLAASNSQDVILLNLEDKIYSTDPLNIMRGQK
jgi:membrane protease subunit HflK